MGVGVSNVLYDDDLSISLSGVGAIDGLQCVCGGGAKGKESETQGGRGEGPSGACVSLGRPGVGTEAQEFARERERPSSDDDDKQAVLD